MEPRSQNRFRAFEDDSSGVRSLYGANHRGQCVDFVRAKQAEYLPLRRRSMGIFESIEQLERLVDESDPDTELSQLHHALQTAESLRADGAPRWLVLTGFVHDLGKVLCLFGEPQWAVVGDTFPVGCAFSERVVYAELFAENPDAGHPIYSKPLGMYEAGCGLGKLLLSWGHDEYLYHVMRPYLPAPALAIIRYHSFYAWHQQGAYQELLAPEDDEILRWVKRFNPHDLYSKGNAAPDWSSLRPYYEALVAEFLPATLDW